MPHISILSASIRTGRVSHRVALYFKKYITENNLATVEILDLNEYQFPLFHERLDHQENPLPQTLEFADKIRLYKDWQRKPIAISTVSDGSFGGTQVITSLQFSLWKIRAWVVPAMCPMPKANELLDGDGNPADKATLDKRAKVFTGELLWCIEAKRRMEAQV
jgi:NAD(P)H-dependent FMN reductase